MPSTPPPPPFPPSKVEFRGDGYNHFICKSYPDHSHWTMGGAEGNELTISWGKYGTYEILVDGAANAGAGNLQGQPTNWRKMTKVRDLGVTNNSDVPNHDHDHEHTENCGH